jgi:hypothetical protein
VQVEVEAIHNGGVTEWRKRGTGLPGTEVRWVYTTGYMLGSARVVIQNGSEWYRHILCSERVHTMWDRVRACMGGSTTWDKEDQNFGEWWQGGVSWKYREASEKWKRVISSHRCSRISIANNLAPSIDNSSMSRSSRGTGTIGR